MSDTAVRVEDLRKSYRTGFWRTLEETLRGVSFTVPAGRAVGYLGANGAGKTTTLKILVGLLEPDGGTCEVLGLPVDDPACRRRVGFLPENPYFYEHLTAREALEFYGGLSRMAAGEVSRRGPELLARVGLEGAAGRRLGTYSKGMRQRLGLAQALLHDPELLILDEPMSGLDPFGRMLVRDLILEERSRGRTVLFSSHILGDVEEVCDFAVILSGGRVTAAGPVRDLLGGAAAGWEAAVRGAGPEVFEKAAPGRVRLARRDGDLARALLPGDLDPAALHAAAAAAGGVVVELIPRRESLEDLFVRTGGTVRDGDGGGEG